MLDRPRSITYRIAFTAIVTLGLVAGYLGLHHQVLLAQDRYTYHAGPAQLVLTSSGQLWNTHFQQPMSHYQGLYHYNGSEIPSRRYVSWSRGLLSIGVNQIGRRSFKGFFAVTEPTFPSGSFVETSLTPIRANPKPGQIAETIVAVQTATTDENGQINYVIASLTQTYAHNSLQLGFANGVVARAKTYILRSYKAPHLFTSVTKEPLTITTNGQHNLKIWLGSHLLLNDSRLALHIIPPFQVYLEVQSLGLRYAARFHGLFIYRSNRIILNDLPNGTTVTVSGPHGTPLARGSSHADRFAFDLTPPKLQLPVTIRVTAGQHTTIFPDVVVKGGDVFAYHS